MTSQFVGSDFTDGALLPNYVNGRLLVAEDLATEQSSLRTRDTRIGEAAGSGVVRGLWVTNSATTVTVTAGLALSHSGSPVVLAQPVTLQLTFTTAAATPTDASTFACCGGSTADGQGSSLTTGVYVLTARPACKLDGSAPMAPAPGSTTSPCCAAQWQVEGVEFRAIALPVSGTVAGVTMTTGNRRNLVAHWCFGTQQLAALGADPFTFDPRYGGLDTLDPADLTPYDVPLATFGWDGSSVTDLDNWSVRRRVTDPNPVPSSWSVTTTDRRVSDGQARFLQFQDQAEQLVSLSLAGSAEAADFFGLLPPVGFLPVQNNQLRSAMSDRLSRAEAETADSTEAKTEDQVTLDLQHEWAARSGSADAAERGYYQDIVDVLDTTVGYGFSPQTFFGGLARFGGLIRWDLAEWALQQSWRVEPVRTNQSVVAGGTSTTGGAAAGFSPPITYYYVVENLVAAQSSVFQGKIGTSRADIIKGRFGFFRSNLYVVFIANQRWVSGAAGPFISDQFGGGFAESPQ